MKQKPPTRERLQAEIEHVHNLLTTSKATLSLNAQTISTLEKQKQDLSSERDAAYKVIETLGKKLSSRFHWIETTVAIVVISTFTFTIGLNVSRKPSERGKPVAWLSIPSVDSLTYSNMNSAFDNATKTNKILTPVTNRVISTNQITDTSRAMWITNLISNFNFYNASNRFTNQPVITNKTHHPIVTRKGAEMLRK